MQYLNSQVVVEFEEELRVEYDEAEVSVKESAGVKDTEAPEE